MQARKSALLEVGTVLTSFAHAPLEARPRLAEEAGLTPVDQYVGSDQGRQAFETYTGYTVVGSKVVHALLSGSARGELAMHGEGELGTDVRLYPYPFSQPGQRGSVIFIFPDDRLCVLPIMPGYIGTLHVPDGRVVSLSFEVSRQLRGQLGESEQDLQVLARRRALAAALSTSGKLDLADGEATSFARFLRRSKRADPTLGIYAAYAYAQSGDDQGAASVKYWFRQHQSLSPGEGLPTAPVPFDVAMLARELSVPAASQPPGIAPFCPMMTLGWSLLPSFVDPKLLHPAIMEAGRKRLNAEWTTFNRKDVPQLLAAFERGELQ